MQLYRQAILLILLISKVLYLQAQVEFKASAQTQVSEGEQFRLTFSLNANGSHFQGPDLSAFHANGPFIGRSGGTVVINGRLVQDNTSYTWTYLLQAKKAGTYQINPASVVVKGRKYTSNALTIKVDKSQTPNIGNKDIYAAITLSKKEVWWGEPLVASLQIYTQYNLNQTGAEYPDFDGFWKEELLDPGAGVSTKRQTINGKQYIVGTFYKSLLYPQRSGTLTIDPMVLDVNVHKPAGFYRYIEEPRTLRSAQKTVVVKPLPENKPEDFTGAVGQFDMAVKVNQTSLKSNESFTLTISISGRGNYPFFDPPKLNLPKSFEYFDPEIKTNTSHESTGTSGFRVYEYLIIPRRPGEFKDVKVSFSFFDPAKGQYRTVYSDSFDFNIAQGEENSREQGIAEIDKDIRHIQTNQADFRLKNRSILDSFWYYPAYILMLILLAAAYFGRRYWLKQQANVVLMKNRRASKVSRKRLKSANKHLKNNNKQEFYSAILQALWGYLSDKLNISQGELSRDNIKEVLTTHQCQPEDVDQLIALLDTCEYARYADQGADMQSIYNQASGIIGNFERYKLNK